MTALFKTAPSMNPLTEQQRNRCVELLEVIVRPGDNEFAFAIEEAQKMFGYFTNQTSKKLVRRRRKRIGYYDLRPPTSNP